MFNIPGARLTVPRAAAGEIVRKNLINLAGALTHSIDSVADDFITVMDDLHTIEVADIL